MSDEQTTEATAPKKVTEYEEVTMTDGRKVKFAGKRQLQKEVIVDLDAQKVSVRFDFRNGETKSLSSSDLTVETNLLALGHGLSQKVGDESAGVQKVEDMVLGTEAMIERLKQGEWTATRAAGDSFSGASVVIRAICEVTGKDVDYVKTFLNNKLEKAKAAGEKLTRADLYASFRNPASPTGKVIQRMEEEERSKASKANASDLLAEMGA